MDPGAPNGRWFANCESGSVVFTMNERGQDRIKNHIEVLAGIFRQ